MPVTILDVRPSKFPGATFALNEMSQSKPGDTQILPPAAGTHITSICFLISFIMLRYKLAELHMSIPLAASEGGRWLVTKEQATTHI